VTASFEPLTDQQMLEAGLGHHLEAPVPLYTEPAVPMFPVACLPPWWRKWVEAVAEEAQVPADLPSVISLGILSATIAGRVRVQSTPGHTEPTNLFCVVAMPPASRKSSVFACAIAPLREAERALAEDAAPVIAEVTARKRLAEDRAECLRKQASNTRATPKGHDQDLARFEYVEAAQEAEEITVPAEPRLLADDATTEALGSLAAEQGGRITVASAEAGLIDIVFSGRYTGGTPATDLLLRGHAGDSYSVDRKGRVRERIDSLSITLALTFQPVVLDSMKSVRDSGGSRGELERFLFAIPPSPLGTRKIRTTAVPEAVQSAYEATVGRLAREFYDPENTMVLRFDSDAQETWYAFAEELEPEFRPDGYFGERHMEGWGGKLAGAVARISGALHMASGRGGDVIDAPTVEAAIKLGHYFIDHAARAFWQMGTGDTYGREREVVALIRRKGWREFTGNELWRVASRSRWAKAAEFHQVLDSLAELGWLIRHEREQHGPGRPASTRYTAHPAVFEERR
jgi:hypothetical protein